MASLDPSKNDHKKQGMEFYLIPYNFAYNINLSKKNYAQIDYSCCLLMIMLAKNSGNWP